MRAARLRTRRWWATSIVAVALVSACGAEDALELREAREIDTTDSAPPPPLPEVRVATGEGRRAKRRIAEGCAPAEEARKYAGFVGDRALAILRWSGASEQTAALEIPVYVVGIDGGVIRVRFLQFPMREQYLHVWLGSGHIEAAPENVFLLHACSARLEPWKAGAGTD